MPMNRRAFALAAASALAFALPASAQDELRPRTDAAAAAQPELVTLEGADREAALAQANASLNAVTRLQSRFVQTAPDGSTAAGTLYLQRPGKLRFQYDPPATLLIVSDGSVVALRDTALRSTERTTLRSTPLNLILRSQINLERDASISRVARSGEWLVVTARDSSGQTDGAITLHFRGPNAELRSWDVIDAIGARTRITLSNITQPESLSASLFRLEDMLERDRPGGRP